MTTLSVTITMGLRIRQPGVPCSPRTTTISFFRQTPYHRGRSRQQTDNCALLIADFRRKHLTRMPSTQSGPQFADLFGSTACRTIGFRLIRGRSIAACDRHKKPPLTGSGGSILIVGFYSAGLALGIAVVIWPACSRLPSL